MKKQLLQAAGLITGIALISKILGFFRELFMASYFGTSIIADAYFIASIIPVLLFTAVGMAITTGLVPLYAELKKQTSKDATEVINVLSTLFAIIAVVITFIALILTPWMTKIMAPGFTDDQLHLTNQLTMIMLPSFCFYVLSAVSTGILEYEKEFAPPALGAIPQNIFIIISIVVLSRYYGIYGVAVATLLGALGQFLIQYPFIKKYKVLRLNFHFKTYRSMIKRTFLSLTPLMIASIAYQLNAVVDRMIASHLQDGSVSALNYANKLLFLPLSIVLLSFITVIFPSIVDVAAEKRKELTPLVIKGLSIITLIGIPITAVMLIESHAFITVIYQRGAFDLTATLLTSSAFFFYTFGMIAIALKEFLNRTLIALHREKGMMTAGVISIVINIILSLILSKYLHIGGVALATSISMFVQTLILLYMFKKAVKPSPSDLRAFTRIFSKLFILFTVTALSLKACQSLYHQQVPSFFSIVLTTGLAVGLTIGFSLLLKMDELLLIRHWIQTKWRK